MYKIVTLHFLRQHTLTNMRSSDILAKKKQKFTLYYYMLQIWACQYACMTSVCDLYGTEQLIRLR